MNEVFENNAALASIRNFYFSYRRILLSVFFALIFLISAFLLNAKIKENNNAKAAAIYNKWISQQKETSDQKELSDQLFYELTSKYKKTGYAKIAILDQASIKARDGDLEKALKNYKELKEITDGIGGNKLFNKLARINAARILYSQEEYDQALDLLEKYSASSNALIHELVGDILKKQNKIELAKEQYYLAKEKYIDEASISIVSMKIANINI
jgi:predicted negative regulator of RcsB-dependent stress response